MSTRNDPTNDMNEELDIDDLASVLEEDDLVATQDSAGDDAEEPTDNSQEHNQQEEEESAGDSEETEESEEGDEPDKEDEESEEEEEETEAENNHAVQSLQKRVDQLTARSKSAEEEVDNLKSKLAEAEAKAGTGNQMVTPPKYQTEKDLEERDRYLRETVRGLEDLVTGEPNWVTDPITGEKTDNMVKIGEQEYPARQVRQRMRELTDERDDLPRERETLKTRAAANAEARTLLPSAWRAGTPAHQERLNLLKAYPGVETLGEQAVVELVLGRMALAQRKARTSNPSKTIRGPKSGAQLPRATKKIALSAKRINDAMDIPDRELAELAAEIESM